MSLTAIIKTGGKQYLVKEGDIFRVEKLSGQAGDKISFKNPLLVFDLDKSEVQIGQPQLKGEVKAEILEQGKGKKIKIVKYKPKVRYRRKTGHRQPYAKVQITEILGL